MRLPVVVNTAGPWIDLANRTLGQETRLIGETKDSHLVVDAPALRKAVGEVLRVAPGWKSVKVADEVRAVRELFTRVHGVHLI